MTKQELHMTPDFVSLQTDQRFVALLMYLRTNRPKAKGGEAHQMIQDSGRLDEYLDMVDRITTAFTAPSEKPEQKTFAPYSNLPLSTENQKL